ncbi:MAG: ABC transporter substrate-binding protein [Chloroflexi bacterium]|nr:ABC transporter substrate-binding protein [Chloroflexota bacterium]
MTHPRLAPLALALALGLVAGCSPRPVEEMRLPEATPSVTATVTPAAFPRTVTDRTPAAVTIAERPVRIVSLAPGITETLFAIGAGPRLVATDTFSDYPEPAKTTTKVDYSRPSAEQVVALRPDLVLLSSRQRDMVTRFRDLQLPVVFLGDPGSLEDVFANMRLIGRVAGEDEAAETLVRGLERRVEAVRAATAAAPAGPRVFYELTPSLYSASERSFIGSMFTLLGATNIALGPTPYPQLTAERVIAADPEVIFLGYVGTTKVDASSVARRPGWSAVTAVRSGRVVQIDPDITNRPGPRVVDALEAIARALYP